MKSVIINLAEQLVIPVNTVEEACEIGLEWMREYPNTQMDNIIVVSGDNLRIQQVGLSLQVLEGGEG